MVSTHNLRSRRTPKVYDYGPCPSRPVIHPTHFPHPTLPFTNISNPTNGHGAPLVYPRQINDDMVFDPADWALCTKKPWNIPVDRNSWPPTEKDVLLYQDLESYTLASAASISKAKSGAGEPDTDSCLGRYCWQTTRFGPTEFLCAHDADDSLPGRCDHTLQEWLAGGLAWESRFQIKEVGVKGMGFGIFTKESWKKGDPLGAYVGRLVPRELPNTDYCHLIYIGPVFLDGGDGKKDGKKKRAYIDSSLEGNWTRFINHSCVPNAEIQTCRIGKCKALVVVATRDIRKGEQLTIDYEDEYFLKRRCLCGEVFCKYKEEANPIKRKGGVGDEEEDSWDETLEMSKKKRGEGSSQTGKSGSTKSTPGKRNRGKDKQKDKDDGEDKSQLTSSPPYTPTPTPRKPLAPNMVDCDRYVSISLLCALRRPLNIPTFHDLLLELEVLQEQFSALEHQAKVPVDEYYSNVLSTCREHRYNAARAQHDTEIARRFEGRVPREVVEMAWKMYVEVLEKVERDVESRHEEYKRRVTDGEVVPAVEADEEQETGEISAENAGSGSTSASDGAGSGGKRNGNGKRSREEDEGGVEI
ncbi:hypothetical protein BCR34DRAFT_646130 [Clohesyomyces aquaticus]|uniref:SET domain-containing protein n=1 Tax=Clohesyomyces aquaticus TaxID=1231657 RepID=A0A1Y1ZWE3_9PLEO|nr:hypothetical protein BCR34DRAFT_646130 [Clohesyomyces aquaticus]